MEGIFNAILYNIDAWSSRTQYAMLATVLSGISYFSYANQIAYSYCSMHAFSFVSAFPRSLLLIPTTHEVNDPKSRDFIVTREGAGGARLVRDFEKCLTRGCTPRVQSRLKLSISIRHCTTPFLPLHTKG